MEVLPPPRIGGFPPSPNEMIGKSFIDSKTLASDGEVAKVIQFHESGKLSTYDVNLPEMTHSNAIHGIGFYSVRGKLVEMAEYGYDSGIPGYRYFKGTYEINDKGNELKQGQHVAWTLTSTKFKATRNWKTSESINTLARKQKSIASVAPNRQLPLSQN